MENDTHKKVDELAWRKAKEEAEKELKSVANENIAEFTKTSISYGLRKGLKIGFWGGVVFSLVFAIIIYAFVN